MEFVDTFVQSCPWVQFVQPNQTHQMTNPTQPNPYQSENLDPGPNPTHNPTDPIKTTTNLLVQERQLSNRSREEIHKTIWCEHLPDLPTYAMAISVHYIGGFDEFSAYKDF